MTKEEYLILRNFKNNCVSQVPVCGELMYRIGHIGITLKYEDFSMLYIDEEMQRVRGYLQSIENKEVKPVTVPIDRKTVNLIRDTPEDFDVVFNITDSVDYDYDLMKIISNPVVLNDYGKMGYSISRKVKRYEYPADSLTTTEISNDVKLRLEKIYNSIRMTNHVVLQIYMRGNFPCARIYNMSGINVFDGTVNGVKDKMTQLLKLNPDWVDIVENIIDLYGEKGICLYQMYLILHKNFYGKLSVHREITGEYTMLFY